MKKYFVRDLKGNVDLEFNDRQEASETARKLAESNKGARYYHGLVGCDPRNEHYYCYDKYFKMAVEFCCND